jgi:uncharacterized membrane protein YcaP (DUF421 family)
MSVLVASLVSILQSFALFIFLILALRVFSRRTMAQITLLGYLIIALLGSAVESALYAGSSSTAAGIAAATTIMTANVGLSLVIQKSERARRFFVNSPMVLVHDGQLVRDQLRRSRLTREDVMEVVRTHGHASLDDVQYVVLEVDGSIAVIGQE